MKIPAFIHIFKCSGSSLFQEARKQLGPDAVIRANSWFPDFSELINQAASREGTRLIGGHFGMSSFLSAAPRNSAERFRFFSIVREPLSRAVSAYNYWGAPEATARSARAADWHNHLNSLSVHNFYEFIIDRYPGVLVGHQCRALNKKAETNFKAVEDALVSGELGLVGTSKGVFAPNDEIEKLTGVRFEEATIRNASKKLITFDDLERRTIDLLKEALFEDIKLYNYVDGRGGIVFGEHALQSPSS